MTRLVIARRYENQLALHLSPRLGEGVCQFADLESSLRFYVLLNLHNISLRAR